MTVPSTESRTGRSTQIGTPRTASTMPWKPWKSMPRKRLIARPESSWIARVTQRGPPAAYAELSFTRGVGGSIWGE